MAFHSTPASRKTLLTPKAIPRNCLLLVVNGQPPKSAFEMIIAMFNDCSGFYRRVIPIERETSKSF